MCADYTNSSNSNKHTLSINTMNKTKCDIGVIGMGVMGYSLLMNLADHKFTVAGLDTDRNKIESFNEEHAHSDITFFANTVDFVQQLSTPRKLLLMVPAGKPVDAVIDSISPYLSKGDIIMDGGNSHFEETNRRFQHLTERGIHYWGVGVSGGQEGARFGPSIMPGGDREVYHEISPYLEAISAKVDGEPCVAYLGSRSAGHYVKMVHNGIEYGLMQVLAESYDLLHRGLSLENDEIASIYATWNKGRLNSFLVEITGNIFLQKDEKDDARYLIDQILDQAKQKGTGKWTSQSALDLGIPIPNIDVAVMMRYVSAHKDLRVKAEKLLPYPKSKLDKNDKRRAVDLLEEAVYAAFLITYAQGFHLLKSASDEFDYGLELREIAKIWRGGCIIRAELLNDIMNVYDSTPGIEHLLISSEFLRPSQQARGGLSEAIRIGVFNQLPVAAFSAALGYLDAIFSERLPANLIQAQRDYFGAHTYQRIDIPGTFHTQWYETEQ